MSAPLRIGALISGGGRTLLNLADRIAAGELDAEIAVVVASRPGAAGIDRARDRGLEVHVVDSATYPSDDARHDALDAALRARDVDLVCLCGYMRWLRVAEDFRWKVLNIHPALLPDFGGRGMYGSRVHAAVLAAGRRTSGCTVHFVDGEYDHGPVILRRTCAVRPEDDVDTLAARVFAEECVAYPEAIRLFASGRLAVVDGRVEIRSEPGAGVRI